MILSIYEWIRRFGNIDIIENFLFFSSIYYKKKKYYYICIFYTYIKRLLSLCIRFIIYYLHCLNWSEFDFLSHALWKLPGRPSWIWDMCWKYPGAAPGRIWPNYPPYRTTDRSEIPKEYYSACRDYSWHGTPPIVSIRFR